MTCPRNRNRFQSLFLKWFYFSSSLGKQVWNADLSGLHSYPEIAPPPSRTQVSLMSGEAVERLAPETTPVDMNASVDKSIVIFGVVFVWLFQFRFQPAACFAIISCVVVVRRHLLVINVDGPAYDLTLG